MESENLTDLESENLTDLKSEDLTPRLRSIDFDKKEGNVNHIFGSFEIVYDITSLVAVSHARHHRSETHRYLPATRAYRSLSGPLLL